MKNTLCSAVLVGAVLVSPESYAQKVQVSERCKNILNHPNALCVNQSEDGKFYMTHYQNGVIKNQFLTSPGKPQKDGGSYTPTGTYKIDRKSKSQPTNYGGSLKNALHIDMPQTRYNGVYTHAGNTDGYRRSHGCLRVASKVSAYLYNTIPTGTQIAIDNTHPSKK